MWVRHGRYWRELHERRRTVSDLWPSKGMLLMPSPGETIVYPNCACCGGSSSSVSLSSASGSSSSLDCSCCCSFFVGGVESACGNCIISRTSRSPTDPCYSGCITDPKITPSLTIVHGGTSETVTANPTDCTNWKNYTSLPPFQTSATLLNNLFTFFYVRSTSPLCIYTATGVPCVNGQTFTWNVSPPGTGCPATLTGTISW